MQVIARRVRNARKKLQRVTVIEGLLEEGQTLNEDQVGESFIPPTQPTSSSWDVAGTRLHDEGATERDNRRACEIGAVG